MTKNILQLVSGALCVRQKGPWQTRDNRSRELGREACGRIPFSRTLRHAGSAGESTPSLEEADELHDFLEATSSRIKYGERD